MKTALITGVTGQDGAYLAQLLLGKGYHVIGCARRSSAMRPYWRLEELGILRQIRLVDLDLCEYSNVMAVLSRERPDELYNLAAQSFVDTSFTHPLYTGEVNGQGVVRLLEAIHLLKLDTRFYQASTSEMFGLNGEGANENTALHPRSPYASAKAFAHHTVENYREAFGIYASSGILFNHESPLRGPEFVSRKITETLARIATGSEEVLELGYVEAHRDWGYAADYVDGMWRMLQQERPGTWVLATGQMHKVSEFLALALAHFELTAETCVRINSARQRPAEVYRLWGDWRKARSELGWEPSVDFAGLVKMMCDADAQRNEVAR